ncbi:MAG: zinc ribbon domain-containing protein [Candidatus Poseidoniaceae archaeon]|nr:zinc ribbon domain-containing protein [Candidatus Poseidoniaceae archaeon]
MGFCINCGQQHQDGIRFCRFCGNQQPGEQLLARLRSEAEQIHYQRFSAGQPHNQNNTMARVQETRQQADLAAQQRHQNQQFRQPRW